jgi:hypothetical protein
VGRCHCYTSTPCPVCPIFRCKRYSSTTILSHIALQLYQCRILGFSTCIRTRLGSCGCLLCQLFSCSPNVHSSSNLHVSALQSPNYLCRRPKRERRQAQPFTATFTPFQECRLQLEAGNGHKLRDIPVASQRIQSADEEDEAVKLLHSIVNHGSSEGTSGQRIAVILEHKGWTARNGKSGDAVRFLLTTGRPVVFYD